MLEKLKYINHLNEVIEFGKDGIFANANDLRNYEWTVKKKGKKIDGFDYDIRERTLPVIIQCSTAEEAVAAKNRLFETVEKDVIAQQFGRLVIGDYYLKCYVTKSQKSDYLKAARYMSLSLTITTDYPFWFKETKHIFRKTSESGADSKNLDYPFDYAFDFKSETGSDSLNNRSLAASNFRMTIYGICTNPEITIGDHLYKINGKVGKNEFLTIDSVTKKIFLTTNDGKQINRFNDRYRRSYIFEKIPAGNVPVVWVGEYGFDLILYDERSEPKWT